MGWYAVNSVLYTVEHFANQSHLCNIILNYVRFKIFLRFYF